MLSPQEEGLEILKVLDQYFPKRFEGKDSIQWLHRFSNHKKQDEWAAFFFQDYSFPLLTKFLGGWKGPRITNSSRFDYQREYAWDLKLKANHNVKGKPLDWAPLNDIRSTERVIGQESGIGLVIANVDFTYDKDGSLRKWRNKLEGSKRTGGKGTHVLKKAGNVTDLKAVFIPNMREIKNAITDGWIGIFKQGKNSNGKPREPKYQIKISSVPSKFIINL
ncbi:hypothetical protein [Candidatus Nitrosotalea okcheonensis]|uniref:Uncharacterized protein n=1 Tax=Candidatus Nitrosotalea okcheonensis TaxID=1903276 RepID=A0A2H1FIL9_9ARCH|nr:hypothetical protein [Candidatus Nitrosotalea okcheonensis]SMH72610.1 protein of unknown function [Candidatus Nitrosotalea okcheonensis]